MRKNINDAVSLTSYLFQLPPARHIVLAIILMGLVLGIATDMGKTGTLIGAASQGLLILSIPALLSCAFVQLLLRKTPFRRIAATALGGEVVYAIAYIAGLIAGDANPFLSQLILLLGSAIVFVLWYAIARFVFILRYRSILFAVIQLFFYLVFLINSSHPALAAYGDPFGIAARFYISSFVLLGALTLFLYIINAPMKKNLGVSSTDALSYFFSQWLYHNKDMEKAFDAVGEEAKTIVTLLAFKRKDGFIFFLTPYVHFGPFGNLGGSEFSYLMAKELDDKYKSKTFVFHGTVTHDLNPVSDSEMKKIVAEVDMSLKGARFEKSSVSYSIGNEDECKAQNLRIGNPTMNSAMLSMSRAPQLTEDINFGLGLAMIAEAEKKVDLAMVVDQHNAETGEITSFEPGSAVGYKYLEAIKAAVAKTAQAMPLRIGTSFKSVQSETIGRAGIKLAILSSSPEYVITLIDSNGITPEFRDKIEKEIKALGKGLGKDFEVGIFTTDTHAINMIRGVLNPLRDEESTVLAIREAVKEAVDDMKDAEFFGQKRWFGINVIGAKQSIELISTINSIVAISKITLPLIMIGGLLLIIAIASRFGA